jgi:hypothetical protein
VGEGRIEGQPQHPTINQPNGESGAIEFPRPHGVGSVLGAKAPVPPKIPRVQLKRPRFPLPLADGRNKSSQAANNWTNHDKG